MFSTIKNTIQNLITKTYEAPLLIEDINFSEMTQEIVNFVKMQAQTQGFHNSIVTTFSGQEFSLVAEDNSGWLTWWLGSPDGTESWEVCGNGGTSLVAVKVNEYLQS